MANKNIASWKMTVTVLIWTVAAVWALISIADSALGGVLAALSFGAISSMLLTGYSSSDINKL